MAHHRPCPIRKRFPLPLTDTGTAGWTLHGWADRLAQMAERCRPDHPERSKDLAAAAAAWQVVADDADRADWELIRHFTGDAGV